MLPQDFTNRMEQMLGEEYEAFLASYDLPKYQALRINPLKGDKEQFLTRAPFKLEQIAWAEYGFYYGNDNDRCVYTFCDITFFVDRYGGIRRKFLGLRTVAFWHAKNFNITQKDRCRKRKRSTFNRGRRYGNTHANGG